MSGDTGERGTEVSGAYRSADRGWRWRRGARAGGVRPAARAVEQKVARLFFKLATSDAVMGPCGSSCMRVATEAAHLSRGKGRVAAGGRRAARRLPGMGSRGRGL